MGAAVAPPYFGNYINHGVACTRDLSPLLEGDRLGNGGHPGNGKGGIKITAEIAAVNGGYFAPSLTGHMTWRVR